MKIMRGRNEGQIFVSHSKKDEQGLKFLRSYSADAGTELCTYEFRGPNPPHAITLRKEMERSISMFILMSDHVLTLNYTAAWVSFEVGLAHALRIPIVLFEAIPNNLQLFELPKRLLISHVDYIMYFNPETIEKEHCMLQQIFNSAKPKPGQTQIETRDALVSTLDYHFTNNKECRIPTCMAKYKLLSCQSEYICPVCRTISYNVCPICKGYGEIEAQTSWGNPIEAHVQLGELPEIPIEALTKTKYIKCLTCDGKGRV